MPEAYRSQYTETDGRFHLDEIEVDDGAELRGALDHERSERKTAKALLEKFKGLDPDQAREALESIRELEDKKLRDQGNFEKLKERWREQQAKELSARDTRIASMDKELRKFKLDDKIRAAALKAGVQPRDIEDVMTLTSSHFELNESGSISVLDRQGNPTLASVEEFFGQTYKADKPQFYGASGAGGSGAPVGGTGGGGGGQRTVKRADFDKMGPSEQMNTVRSGCQVID